MNITKRAKWAVIALVIANEIRGAVVVVTIGWPLLKALYAPHF